MARIIPSRGWASRLSKILSGIWMEVFLYGVKPFPLLEGMDRQQKILAPSAPSRKCASRLSGAAAPDSQHWLILTIRVCLILSILALFLTGRSCGEAAPGMYVAMWENVRRTFSHIATYRRRAPQARVQEAAENQTHT